MNRLIKLGIAIGIIASTLVISVSASTTVWKGTGGLTGTSTTSGGSSSAATGAAIDNADFYKVTIYRYRGSGGLTQPLSKSAGLSSANYEKIGSIVCPGYNGTRPLIVGGAYKFFPYSAVEEAYSTGVSVPSSSSQSNWVSVNQYLDTDISFTSDYSGRICSKEYGSSFVASTPSFMDAMFSSTSNGMTKVGQQLVQAAYAINRPSTSPNFDNGYAIVVEPMLSIRAFTLPECTTYSSSVSHYLVTYRDTAESGLLSAASYQPGSTSTQTITVTLAQAEACESLENQAMSVTGTGGYADSLADALYDALVFRYGSEYKVTMHSILYYTMSKQITTSGSYQSPKAFIASGINDIKDLFVLKAGTAFGMKSDFEGINVGFFGTEMNTKPVNLTFNPPVLNINYYNSNKIDAGDKTGGLISSFPVSIRSTDWTQVKAVLEYLINQSSTVPNNGLYTYLKNTVGTVAFHGYDPTTGTAMQENPAIWKQSCYSNPISTIIGAGTVLGGYTYNFKTLSGILYQKICDYFDQSSDKYIGIPLPGCTSGISGAVLCNGTNETLTSFPKVSTSLSFSLPTTNTYNPGSDGAGITNTLNSIKGITKMRVLYGTAARVKALSGFDIPNLTNSVCPQYTYSNLKSANFVTLQSSSSDAFVNKITSTDYMPSDEYYGVNSGNSDGSIPLTVQAIHVSTAEILRQGLGSLNIYISTPIEAAVYGVEGFSKDGSLSNLDTSTLEQISSSPTAFSGSLSTSYNISKYSTTEGLTFVGYKELTCHQLETLKSGLANLTAINDQALYLYNQPPSSLNSATTVGMSAMYNDMVSKVGATDKATGQDNTLILLAIYSRSTVTDPVVPPVDPTATSASTIGKNEMLPSELDKVMTNTADGDMVTKYNLVAGYTKPATPQIWFNNAHPVLTQTGTSSITDPKTKKVTTYPVYSDIWWHTQTTDSIGAGYWSGKPATTVFNQSVLNDFVYLLSGVSNSANTNFTFMGQGSTRLFSWLNSGQMFTPTAISGSGSGSGILSGGAPFGSGEAYSFVSHRSSISTSPLVASYMPENAAYKSFMTNTVGSSSFNSGYCDTAAASGTTTVTKPYTANFKIGTGVASTTDINANGSDIYRWNLSRSSSVVLGSSSGADPLVAWQNYVSANNATAFSPIKLFSTDITVDGAHDADNLTAKAIDTSPLYLTDGDNAGNGVNETTLSGDAGSEQATFTTSLGALSFYPTFKMNYIVSPTDVTPKTAWVLGNKQRSIDGMAAIRIGYEGVSEKLLGGASTDGIDYRLQTLTENIPDILKPIINRKTYKAGSAVQYQTTGETYILGEVALIDPAYASNSAAQTAINNAKIAQLRAQISVTQAKLQAATLSPYSNLKPAAAGKMSISLKTNSLQAATEKDQIYYYDPGNITSNHPAGSNKLPTYVDAMISLSLQVSSVLEDDTDSTDIQTSFYQEFFPGIIVYEIKVTVPYSTSTNLFEIQNVLSDGTTDYNYSSEAVNSSNDSGVNLIQGTVLSENLNQPGDKGVGAVAMGYSGPWSTVTSKDYAISSFGQYGIGINTDLGNLTIFGNNLSNFQLKQCCQIFNLRGNIVDLAQ